MAADNITKTIWNKAHYDYIAVCVVKGSREQVAAIAKAKGYSLSQYIKHLIIADNPENADISAILGGGGDSRRRAALHQRHARP